MPNSSPLLYIERYRYQEQDLAISIPKLAIYPGEIHAITGSSGAGKTLSSRCLMQLIDRNRQSGRMHFQDHNLLSCDQTTLNTLRQTSIGYVPSNQLHLFNPLRPILFHLHESISSLRAMSRTEKQDLAMWWLAFMELEESVAYAYPHQLSGGQRQRILLIMGMLNQTKLLILDEPTTALDPHLTRKIRLHLNDCATKHGQSIVLISHDTHFVRLLAHKHYRMENGTLTQCPLPPKAHSSPPTTSKPPLSSPISSKRFDALAPCTLSANNLQVSLSSRQFWKPTLQKTLLHPSTFQIAAGETVGIYGPSGSGKTTLALALMQLTDYQGSIEILGKKMKPLSASMLRSHRKHFQMVFQDPVASLAEHRTISQCLFDVLHTHFPSHPAPLSHIHAHLEAFNLSENLLNTYPTTCSHGELQRINIIRTLLVEPKILVLDEVTSHLDAYNTSTLMRILRTYQVKHQASILFISHDVPLLQTTCDKMLHVVKGRVHCHAPLCSKKQATRSTSQSLVPIE